MSTINKILKTAAVIGFFNGGISYFQNSFVESFVTLGLVITLPALGVVVIDRVVNQNITSNKIIQYGLTAVETMGICPNFYGEDNVIMIAFTTCQSLAFKYIWDSSDEIPELNTEFDQQPDLIEELNS